MSLLSQIKALREMEQQNRVRAADELRGAMSGDLVEVVACFRDGDADQLASIARYFEAPEEMRIVSFAICKAWALQLRRLQKAAELVEGQRR